MKKNILTLALAIVSSVWMMGEAGERWCMPTVRSIVQTWIRTEGLFQSASAPCTGSEVCPPCLTIVLETDDKTYYLVSESPEIVDVLEHVIIGTHAIIEGQPFQSEEIDYICVSNCYVLGDPIGQPTDTIPLYARDDSGSSTVDPVDPNQIYATLTGNVLTVHNNTSAQVAFTVNIISVNNAAARVRKNGEPTTFTDSISVELAEEGIYEILLTSEEWNYTIYGTVNYIHSAIDVTKEETSTTKKVLRGTQILIEREGKTYTLTGQEVK